MKIYPIQTGTVRCKQFQLTGARSNLSRIFQILFAQKWGEWMPIYCWLIKTNNQLILIDTGETNKIFEEGYLPQGGMYHKVVQTRIEKNEEIDQQLLKLGFKTKDVNKVILTHMHGDHIGGLGHFSHCKILVSQTEYELAASKKGPGNGYFSKNWPEWFEPTLIAYKDNAEGEFANSHKVGDDGSITVVSTPGHSIGHQSIIIKDEGYTYFIAGDLTYNMNTLKDEIADVVLMNKASQETVTRVHKYVRSNDCIYLSSHDWNAPKYLKEKLTYKQFK